MKLLGALSVSRDKVLEFKADAFKKLMLGALSVTRLDYPKMRGALAAYLKSQGLQPTDKSVMAWLQENDGETIALFIFEIDNVIDFKITSGTQAELRQIGEHHGKAKKGNNPQRTTSVRQVNVGQRKGQNKPRHL